MAIKEQLRVLKTVTVKAAKNGFFHIIGGNSLVKIISFLSAFLVIRFLGQEQYGFFSLPNSILSIALIFNGMCMPTAALRYCTITEDERQKKSYLMYGLRVGLVFDIFLIAVTGLILVCLDWLPLQFHHSAIYPVKNIEALLLLSLAAVPFFAFAFDMIQYFLRAECDNRNYSKTSVLFTGSFAVFQILFVLLLRVYKQQVYGLVLGRYFAYILVIAVGIYVLSKKPVLKLKPLPLNRDEKRGMVGFGLNAMIASGFSLLMPYIETVIVNYFVQDANTRAEFSAASLAPSSVQFISVAVCVFIFPYYARNYLNPQWIRSKTRKLLIAMTVGMGVVALLGVLLTPLIVLVFGKGYNNRDEIKLMSVFWVAFAVNSALKMPVGNLLSALGEVRFNTINAFVSTLLQTAICWVLISRYKIAGAAYGLLFGYLISSLIGIGYLVYYCKRLEKRKLKESGEN